MFNVIEYWILMKHEVSETINSASPEKIGFLFLRGKPKRLEFNKTIFRQ
jgi:hypothetical protein